MRLAVIPARGGSKRIPRKNIKLFLGKPIISWSIEAAQKSGCFDRIIVSTDDSEIAEVGLAYGAEVPFLRPMDLADDTACIMPVVAHAISSIDTDGRQVVDEVCCILATAPFIRPNDLQRGLQILHSSCADYAFSVTNYPFPIQRAVRITTGQRVQMFQPEYFHTRSQDLEEAWHDAGQFYWGKANAWLANKELFDTDAAPIPMPRYRVQDIDTEDDWYRAELMYKAQITAA